MFRPLRDNLLVRPIEHVRSTLLHIIDNDQPQLGEIIAKGPKAQGVEIGEIVSFGTTENYLSFPRKTFNNQVYLIMSEKDICFVDDEE